MSRVRGNKQMKTRERSRGMKGERERRRRRETVLSKCAYNEDSVKGVCVCVGGGSEMVV